MNLFVRQFWAWAGLMMLAACGGRDLDAASSKYEGPIAVSTDVEIVYSELGNLRIKGKAPKRIIYQNGDKEYPDSIYLEMYDELGQKTTTITGGYCYEDYQTRTYRAEGNVVVSNLTKGQTLETERLFWNQRDQMIRSDTNIKVITPTETLYGIGMEAKQDFSEYKILRPTGKMWKTFEK